MARRVRRGGRAPIQGDADVELDWLRGRSPPTVRAAVPPLFGSLVALVRCSALPTGCPRNIRFVRGDPCGDAAAPAVDAARLAGGIVPPNLRQRLTCLASASASGASVHVIFDQAVLAGDTRRASAGRCLHFQRALPRLWSGATAVMRGRMQARGEGRAYDPAATSAVLVEQLLAHGDDTGVLGQQMLKRAVVAGIA